MSEPWPFRLRPRQVAPLLPEHCIRDVRTEILGAAYERHATLTERRLRCAQGACQRSRIARVIGGQPGHWELVGLRADADQAVVQRRIDSFTRALALPALPRPVLRWRWA